MLQAHDQLMKDLAARRHHGGPALHIRVPVQAEDPGQEVAHLICLPLEEELLRYPDDRLVEVHLPRQVAVEIDRRTLVRAPLHVESGLAVIVEIPLPDLCSAVVVEIPLPDLGSAILVRHRDGYGEGLGRLASELRGQERLDHLRSIRLNVEGDAAHAPVACESLPEARLGLRAPLIAQLAEEGVQIFSGQAGEERDAQEAPGIEEARETVGHRLPLRDVGALAVDQNEVLDPGQAEAGPVVQNPLE